MAKKVAKDRADPDSGQSLEFVEDLKRQWVALIDALIDPMCIVNTDYEIVKANRAMADLAASSVREVIGKRCHKIFANREQPCEGCKMVQTASASKSNTWSLNQMRDDRYFEVTSQPIVNPDGGLDGIVQVYRDRTEANRLQHQLLQSEKLASIGLLAGGFAHEINNPLGGILIFAQMLKRELPDDSPHCQDVDEILNATERCKAIVESLLEFARQNPADLPDKHEDVKMVMAAKTALRFAKVGQAAGTYDVQEEWTTPEHTVNGDHNKMVQVFLNLIQNAFQAMPDGGSLFLRSYERNANDGGREFVYEVEDTGVGIPDKYQDKIFDPFFTTKEPGEGTGLGLAICYGIIDDMGGQLGLGASEGSGTIFQITFPADDIPAQQPA